MAIVYDVNTNIDEFVEFSRLLSESFNILFIHVYENRKLEGKYLLSNSLKATGLNTEILRIGTFNTTCRWPYFSLNAALRAILSDGIQTFNPKKFVIKQNVLKEVTKKKIVNSLRFRNVSYLLNYGCSHTPESKLVIDFLIKKFDIAIIEIRN
jgi:hypothetical protein